MKNRYLEKIAELTKSAWETDFEDDTHVGISSNRLVGDDQYLHSALLRASTKPGHRVMVQYFNKDGKYREADSYLDKSDFTKKMKGEVRESLDSHHHAYGGFDPSKHMDWHRDFSYSVAVEKARKGDISHEEYMSAVDRVYNALSKS